MSKLATSVGDRRCWAATEAAGVVYVIRLATGVLYPEMRRTNERGDWVIRRDKLGQILNESVSTISTTR